MKKLIATCGTEILVCDKDFELFKHMKWMIDHYGYPVNQVRTNGKVKRRYMHTFLFERRGNLVTDHINRNKLDNTRCNLRKISQWQNSLNSERKPGSTSRFKGVRRKNGKWQARIYHHFRDLNIGVFESEIEAAKAWDRKCLELRGSFAALNFPNQGPGHSKP